MRLSGYKEFQITPESVVDTPQVRALLDLLVYAEGTGGDYGKIVFGVVKNAPFNPELIGQTNVRVSDFSRHPQIDVIWKKGEKTSSAAGRYQILYDTWRGYGGDAMDFSPRSQDIVAIKIMIAFKAVDAILKGDIKTAIFKCGLQWASFPKNEAGESIGKGQHAKPLAELENKYNEFKSKY